MVYIYIALEYILNIFKYIYIFFKYLHLPKFAAGGPWGIQAGMHTVVCCGAYTAMWSSKDEGGGRPISDNWAVSLQPA